MPLPAQRHAPWTSVSLPPRPNSRWRAATPTSTVRLLLSGVQALVRALLEQSRLDRAAGLNTAGLVSGYRGSPLGGVDQELWRREALLTAADIRFQPGLNEDLAATMLWGSQQIDTFPGKRVDGVFGLWYGKGPGVDRSADALRCANTIGTARLGGVLAVSGDDHAAHSSVFPHQTDGIFQSPSRSPSSSPRTSRTSSTSASPASPSPATAASGSR